jgi:hypothetical protein
MNGRLLPQSTFRCAADNSSDTARMPSGACASVMPGAWLTQDKALLRSDFYVECAPTRGDRAQAGTDVRKSPKPLGNQCEERSSEIRTFAFWTQPTPVFERRPLASDASYRKLNATMQRTEFPVLYPTLAKRGQLCPRHNSTTRQERFPLSVRGRAPQRPHKHRHQEKRPALDRARRRSRRLPVREHHRQAG